MVPHETAAEANGDWPKDMRDVPDTGSITPIERVQSLPAQTVGSALARRAITRADLTAAAAAVEATSRRKVLWHQPAKIIRRLSWGIADQGMSSLTNFAVGIYVVRTLGAEQFGAFSIALVTYAFALNASRGLATDPLMVRFSTVDRSVWRRAVASCTGTALFVGVVAGVCVLSAAALMQGTLRLAFLALGLTLPGLMLQDSWRYSFFALGRGSQAFLNDAVWAVVLIPALVMLRVSHHANVFWFTLAWGIGATVGAAVGPLQAQVVPKITEARLWLSRHRDLGARYLAEGVSSAAAGQLRGSGIALLLGLAPLGYVQAASTISGPVSILFLGMALVTIPEAARVLRRSPRHLQLFCVLVSGGLSAGAFAWGAFLLIAVPRGFGSMLIGPIWHKTYPLVLPQMAFLIGQGVAGGAGTGMHALGAARRSVRTVVAGSIFLVVFSIAGAAARGAEGAIQGSAVAAWLSAVVAWWQLRAAIRESGTRTTVALLVPGRHAARRRRPTLAITPISGERVVVNLSIGEVLAEARRRARLTIRQVSQLSGIPEAVIWSIERSDYSAFEDIYARSHIRGIARVLGTNPVPLLEEYDAEVAEPAET